MPRITRIEPQKKRQSRYNVYINDQYVFAISASNLIKYGLAGGDEIDPGKLKTLKEELQVSDLAEMAIAKLAGRPHSKKELETYLLNKIANSKKIVVQSIAEKKSLAQKVIEKLEIQHFVDDLAFAKWLVSQRQNSSRPKSQLAIIAELRSKGVADKIISSLEELSDKAVEAENLTLLADKKLAILKKRYNARLKDKKTTVSTVDELACVTPINRGDAFETAAKAAVLHQNREEIKQKLINYLRQKGFGWEQISGYLNSTKLS